MKKCMLITVVVFIFFSCENLLEDDLVLNSDLQDQLLVQDSTSTDSTTVNDSTTVEDSVESSSEEIVFSQSQVNLHDPYFVGESQTPLVTYNGDIYLAFVDENRNIRVAKNGKVGAFSYPVNSDPTHKAPSLAIDKNGYVHLTGGMHNDPWNYWVSETPETLDFVKKEKLTSDGGITYSGFVKDKNGDLYTYYRFVIPQNNKEGSRAANIAKYDTETKQWVRLGSDKGVFWMPYGKDTNGSGIEWYQPFKVSIVFDEKNIMHIACSANDGNEMSVEQIFYAYYQNGTFYNSNNQVLTLPIDNNSNAFVVKNIDSPSGWGCRVVWDKYRGAGVIYQHQKEHYIAYNNEDWSIQKITNGMHSLYQYSSVYGDVIYKSLDGWVINDRITYQIPDCFHHSPLDLEYFNETGNIRFFRINTSTNQGEVITIGTELNYNDIK